MSFWWKAKQAPLLINQWEKITIFCSDKTQEETAAEAAAEAAAVEATAPEGAEPWMRHGSGIHWPMENQKKTQSTINPLTNGKSKKISAKVRIHHRLFPLASAPATPPPRHPPSHRRPEKRHESALQKCNPKLMHWIWTNMTCNPRKCKSKPMQWIWTNMQSKKHKPAGSFCWMHAFCPCSDGRGINTSNFNNFPWKGGIQLLWMYFEHNS